MKNKISKYGKAKDGVQKYIDCETGKIFQEEYTHSDLYTKFFAIILYFNGLPYRRVGQIIGVHHTTVIKWQKKFGHLFDFKSTFDPNQTFEDVEIDEMFTFIKKKIKRHTFGQLLIEKR